MQKMMNMKGFSSFFITISALFAFYLMANVEQVVKVTSN